MTTLARLSFQVPAYQRPSFAKGYEQQLASIVKKHGCSPVVTTDESSANGFFSRLFEVESPAAVHQAQAALRADAAWQQAVKRLLGPAQDQSPSYRFGLYRAPAGPGTAVRAGPGRRVEAGPGTTRPVGAGLPRNPWHSFTVQDGLPNSIHDLLQDQHGVLWLAGGEDEDGLWSFDGSQVRHFTTDDGLPNCTVNCLLEDRAGNLWIGTEAGLVRYDGRSFVSFTTEDGLGDNIIKALLQDRQGQLWIGTHKGVSRYDGATFTTFTSADGLAAQQVRCIAEDQAGQLWLGVGTGPGSAGLSCYDGQVFTTFTSADGLLEDRILSVVIDGSGQVWVGHPKGVSRGDGQHFAPVFAAENCFTHSMVEDRTGRMWVGCTGELRCFTGGTYQTMTLDGMSESTIFSLAEDQSGQLWLGPVGGGLMRFNGQQLTTFTKADGLAGNLIWDLREDRQGCLWVTTFNGVSWYDGIEFASLEGAAGRFWSTMLEDRQGRMWFGTIREGPLVGCWDGQHFETFLLPLSDAAPQVISGTLPLLEDRQGRLWFSARGPGGGLMQYDGAHWTRFTGDIGLAPGWVNCMLEDRQGQLWFGGGGGLSRFDGQQADLFTTDNGLVHNNVKDLLEDRDGQLWIATSDGLSCYDGHTFTNFTAANGLLSNNLRRLLLDRAGHLWLTSLGGGVAHYDGQVFQHLTGKDGLAHDAVHPVLEDCHGVIWIGTDNGLNRYRPALTPPKVQLQSIIADQRYEATEALHIPLTQKHIAFEFRGQSLTTLPDRMAYVYRLKDCDTHWQLVYSSRVEYQGLPAGEYTFQVRAVDRDLNYSETAEIKVRIEPDALVESLTAALSQSSAQGQFIGTSPALRTVETQLAQVASSDLTVLIFGETGTGKGLAARTLHELSPRRDKPFVIVNCGAIPELLIESELFGHEKGAFTGAANRRLGKVELARDGTLFLDEIGDMPLVAQVKLLHLLEERTFERVGGEKVYAASVRIVAATNRDLQREIDAGTFRQDLYYRLQGFEVQLPPLRDRREDILLLALYFMGVKAAHVNKAVTALAPAAEAALLAHEWLGNVRELQHAIERAVVVCQGATIELADLGLASLHPQASQSGDLLTLTEFERRYILQVLNQKDWVIAGAEGAAAVLGLHEATLRSRMKKLGIRRPQT